MVYLSVPAASTHVRLSHMPKHTLCSWIIHNCFSIFSKFYVFLNERFNDINEGGGGLEQIKRRKIPKRILNTKPCENVGAVDVCFR